MRHEAAMQQQITLEILLVKKTVTVPNESFFKGVSASIPQPAEGQMLAGTRFISPYSYRGGRMSDHKSYLPPFRRIKVLNGGVAGIIMESKPANFVEGKVVAGNLGWQNYSVTGEKKLRKINPDLALVNTPLGVPDMTRPGAYFGLRVIGQPLQGETIVVSGAAGIVETVVGQIAKIHECRVVGIAESDKKTKYLIDELGFDAAINYRISPDLKEILAKACPNGVDICFDNVDGDISDEALENAPKAFIGLCVGENFGRQMVKVN